MICKCSAEANLRIVFLRFLRMKRSGYAFREKFSELKFFLFEANVIGETP